MLKQREESVTARAFTAGVDHSCTIQHDNNDVPSTEIEASAVCLPKAVGGPIITQHHRSLTAIINTSIQVS